MSKNLKEYCGEVPAFSPHYNKIIKPGDKMPMDHRELDKPDEWWIGKGWKPCKEEKPKAAMTAKKEKE